ncbi:MAG: SDR family NAD(P)-dependent oxidoreductase [Thermodesulfobacteriota bacterium]
MTIVVTGCAGFIGSKVCSILTKNGINVVGIDNLNDAYDIRLKEYRLDLLNSEKNFIFHKVDITNKEDLEKCFNKYGDIEAIVNLAARAGVRKSIDIPYEYYLTNVIGTLNLLQISKELNILKFVQASTSSIYGENQRPFSEDQNTDFTISPYAASKKAAENLCYTYHKLFNINISVLRYFTVYGPAGRPDMSPFRFIRWIAQEEDVIVYGDGNQERDFTYVDDIAEGTVLAIKNTGYEIMNLGNDKPIKLNDLIKYIEIKLQKKARIVEQDLHITDVPATWANISKAKRLINWTPKIDIEKGLEFTVDWYNRNKDLANSIDL